VIRFLFANVARGESRRKAEVKSLEKVEDKSPIVETARKAD
jgi:hypothetical protein